MRLNGREWGQAEGVRVIRPPDPDRTPTAFERWAGGLALACAVTTLVAATVSMVCLAAVLVVKVWQNVGVW